MPLKIPFYRYNYLYKIFGKKIIKIIDKVAYGGRYIMQKELSEFEKKFANFTGSKYCVGVSNATDGLQMLLMASGIKKDDEVLVSMHTMIATASAVHFAGAKPVPVGISEEDYLMDPKKIVKKITKKTKGIIVTQLNGRVAKMHEIKKIATKYNLMLFEDSAQALGAKYKNVHAGNFGIGGCFSFYPAKILGCLGDGGAVIMNSKKIFNKILALRDHGRVNNDVKVWGLNARLDNIEAAVLDYLLSKVPSFIEKRRYLARIYNNELKKIKEIKLPPLNFKNSDNFDVFQNYEIIATRSDVLCEYLKLKKIGTLRQWGGKSLNNFKKLKMSNVDIQSDKIFRNLVMLPMNNSITSKEAKYVAQKIKEFYGY